MSNVKSKVDTHVADIGSVEEASASTHVKLYNFEQYVKRTHSAAIEAGRKSRCGKKHQKRVARVHKYEPQIGVVDSILPILQNLLTTNGVKLPPKFMGRVESLLFLFSALYEATSSVQVLSIVGLYFKSWYSESFSDLAYAYAQTILTTFIPQAGEIGIPTQKPAWIEFLGNFSRNWTLFTKNEGFTKLSNFLSLCLSLGLCEASSLDFNLGGMKLFSVGALNKHATAYDLIDALVSTISYFVEGGYACFVRGSFKPLLYGNVELESFEEAFSLCSRCQEYARSGNLMKYEKLSDNDYLSLLRTTLDKGQLLIQMTRGLVEKNILRKKTDSLRLWQATFMQSRVNGGLRTMPYSIGIFGSTGVGKSSIANTLMVTTLLANGFSAADDRIISVNESDKYMSNMRTDIEGIFVDDIGNTKPDFVGTAPSALMIQLVNNVRTYANMADLSQKGNVSIEPHVVVTTKNVKDSCATVYSNEPASIARRDRITITVSVKSEYATNGMLDADKVQRLHPELISSGEFRVPNLWTLLVERAIPKKSSAVNGRDTIGWQVCTNLDGTPMNAVSLIDLIKWIAADSKVHFEKDAELVRSQTNVASRVMLCPMCRTPKPDCCTCTPPLTIYPSDEGDNVSISSTESDEDSGYDTVHFHPQFGEKIGHILHNHVGKLYSNVIPYGQSLSEKTEDAIVNFMLDRLTWLETSPYVCWTNWIPTDWLSNPWCRDAVLWAHSDQLQASIRRTYMNYLFVILVVCVSCIVLSPLCCVLFIVPLRGVARVIQFEKTLLYDKVIAQNACMPVLFKRIRDQHISWITSTCAIIAALYGIVQVIKAVRVVPTPQGNLAPCSDEDICERDKEANPWARATISPMPSSIKAQTTTANQLRDLVFRNLCHVTMGMEIDGTVRTFECDCFFIKSNVALFPTHMWKSNVVNARFTRHSPDTIGGNFSCYIDKKQSVEIAGTDFSLVWVPSGGDWKDLTPYLPLGRYNACPGSLIYKDSSGNKLFSELWLSPQECSTYHASGSGVYKTFCGARYNVKFNTFTGLCMAGIIAELRAPIIAGFHIGGVTGSKEGCCGILLLCDFESAFAKLKACKNIFLCASSGNLSTVKYDVQFFERAEIHPNSPVQFLPPGSNCLMYGEVKGRAKYYSDVYTTPISAHIEKVCGVPNTWGKPKFHKWKPWQASLQYSANPAPGLLAADLDWAREDYTKSILDNLERFPALIADTNPLTQMQNICGRDGIRFIDKIPSSTSIGYPLSGPKAHHMTLCDTKDYPDFQCPVLLDPIFWSEVDSMEQTYLRGERCYPVFKACLKDEPTSLAKDKVRVFQAAPCALQLLIRKYYLPLARVLSVMPLISECAVGLNSQGPEWDEMSRHITRFGSDRILAGDYSKYDLRLPAQVMFTAFSILIDIARACGYSEQDMDIMRGIATDVCYPIMAYNGDLIQLFGSNPSGHNMTVYINSLCNSLLMRSAFHALTPAPHPPFQSICAITTYGDDVKGSVSPMVENFNHISVADYLAAFDMVFTMPDKSGTPTPFMNDADADFLKRKNVFNADLGLYFGALDESSIFKSLHCVLSSSAITIEQQCMQNIDGALREWFFHGREIYESRRSQMQEVATLATLSHGCAMLGVNYDDQLANWRLTYLE